MNTPIPQDHAARSRAFVKTAAAGDWDGAYRIAREPVPADASQSERNEWGARRAIARQCLAEDAEDEMPAPG